jgi:hypothetical protein
MVINAPTMEKYWILKIRGHREIATEAYKSFFAMFAQITLPEMQYTAISKIMIQVSSAVIRGEKFAYPKGVISK